MTIISQGRDLHRRQPKIYGASKVHRASTWRALRDRYDIISRWIDCPETGLAREAYVELWRNCIDDVRLADMMVLWAADGETLKGCLIEAGGMLAQNKPVYQIGDCHSLRAGDGSDASFVQHPLWHRVHGIDEAIAHWLDNYEMGGLMEWAKRELGKAV